MSPPAPIKVVHILNTLQFSGAERMLAAAGDRIGAGRATIIATGREIGPFAPHLAQAGFAIVHLPSAKRAGFLLRLRAAIRSCRPDVVHIHPEGMSVWYSLVARSLGLPSVRTVHNEFRFEGGLRRRRRFTRRMARLLGTRHVACSGRVARNEIARFGVADIAVIDNWADLARIPMPADAAARRTARRALGMAEDGLVSLSIAHEAPAKNLGALVDGLGLLGENAGLRHYHCGAVSAALRESVPPALAGSVRFVGAVPNVADYLAAVDIFVSTSLWEGGPLALLEAAAAGLVCVTTDAGLAEDFAGQPNMIFIAPDAGGVAAGLRAAIAAACGDRTDDRRALSAFARSRYSPERGAGAYMRLYERLVSAAQPRIRA